MLIIVSVYVLMSVEYYDKEQNVSQSKILLKSPFLASKRLLETVGVSIQFEQDYKRLYSRSDDGIQPHTDDTVILADAEAAISSSSASQLLDWVEQGGFLIIAVTASQSIDSHRANALLKQLEVGVTWLINEDILFEDFEQQISSMSDPQGHPIEVGLESSYRITFPDKVEPHYGVKNEDGYTFVQLERGQGLITLMTEIDIWDNWQLDKHDNSILMLGLLGNSDNVYLFDPIEQPHWFLLLYQYSPIFILLLVTLIVMTMWHLGQRFGSIAKSNQQQSPRFSEHIRVAGNFYWDQDKQGQMMASVRSAVLLLVMQKWPHIKGAEQHNIALLLSEFSNLPVTEIDILMFDQKELNQSQFSQYMKGLQQLRKML